MAPIRQSSFAGGELSPDLWGRTELALRATGLRRMRNFFAARNGSAMSRPGTTFVAEAANPVKRVRLIPFVFSDTVSYVLEFGHQNIRFYSGGGVVEDPGAPGSPYEISSPYQNSEVLQLKFAQSGNVLTLCCPGHAPAELVRVAHDNWTLTDIDFARPAIAMAVGSYSLLEALPVADATHPAREWTWKVSRLDPQPDGTYIESAPFTITTSCNGSPAFVTHALPETIAVYPDLPVTVQIYPEAALVTAPRIKHRVYRGRGELFGWVGDTDSWSFTDVGDEPDYSRQPPKGQNPFEVYDYTTATPTLTRTEYPRCVAFFEDRRVFAATDERPAFVWLSAVGDYANFDAHALALASDAAEYALASRKWEEIRSLVGLERLIIPTSSAVWSFSGPGGGAVDPSNNTPPDVRAHVQIGASLVDPLVVGNTVLMVRTKGSGVRDVFYDFQQQSYSGGDISRHAQHLFEQKHLVDWAYAEDPFGIVWALRNDGALLSFTYDREAGIAGWARHDSGAGDEKDGFFESICAVPEGSEDAVYVVVRRTAGAFVLRYIERFASRVLPLDPEGKANTKETIALDSALSYHGVAITTVTGLDHLESRNVMILADGEVAGPYAVTGGEIDISADFPDGAEVIHAGLPFTAEMELLDVGDERTRQKLLTALYFEVVDSRGMKVGEDFDHLTEWRQRKVSDGYSAISAATDMVKVNVKSSWSRGGRAVLRQDNPLFVTVVGVTREVEVGND